MSEASHADAPISIVAAAALEQTRREVGTRCERALVRIERRIQAIRGDLARIGEADSLTHRGQLLSQEAHAIPRGAREVVVQDWAAGVAVTLTLDPSKPARAQAEALFARAKRLKRGAAIAERRLADSVELRDTLLRLRGEILAAAAIEDLEALSLSVPRGPIGARGLGPETKERSPYRRYLSCERPVLVGRGAADNDILTTKIARPHDLWLHAKGMTGAHVVVPLKKGESVLPELLVDAAHLAAHFSDARGETIVEVTYVQRRYVRKPRHSAPGAVTVEREKVLVLRREPERLARLLATVEA